LLFTVVFVWCLLQVVPPDVLYYIDKELLVPLQAIRLGEQHDNFPVFAKYNVPRSSPL
jgi:hypothetical protein